MSGKPPPKSQPETKIAIVGAGNLGSALAESLRQAGYGVEILSRSDAFAKRSRKITTAEVVWLCVPDGEIARAAATLAEKIDWKGRVALHSSGALDSGELDALRRRGAAIASVHPLMTFVRGSRPSLAGVSFAVEGDAGAVRVARGIVKDLGGRAYNIRKQDKAAYHAWATFASPLLTALLATTEQVALRAGITRKAASARMTPILKQTLANYSALGAAGAFSGPIVRGDAATVKRHLRVLEELPEIREVYLVLVRAALRYLPSKDSQALEKAMQAGTSPKKSGRLSP
jgi:predicted short-subunit dehydrogenase-like oxidoreductase (DUF2520 family)